MQNHLRIEAAFVGDESRIAPNILNLNPMLPLLPSGKNFRNQQLQLRDPRVIRIP
jgi:hypothetical protein